MTKKLYLTRRMGLVMFLVALLVFASMQYVEAQGGGGSGSGGDSGVQLQDRDRVQDPTTHEGDEPAQDQDRDQLQTQDQLRDRDRLQDPTTHAGTEPIRDRTQDRDRLQDQTVTVEDKPIQDKDQLRDRLRDQIDEPDQDRDRIRARDLSGLQQVVSVGAEVGNNVATETPNVIRTAERSRNRVAVGVTALLAAEPLVGPFGTEISSLAKQIGSSTQALVQAEERIESRNRFTRFFFGGNKTAADVINTEVERNEANIARIRQFLDGSDSTPEVRAVLEEQLQIMEAEQNRLRDRADKEMSSWGVFSWRF